MVSLKIFNVSGKVVYEQKVKSMQPGSYIQDSPFSWNAVGYPSGIYFYSFELSTGEVAFSKLMLIK